jgi:hypothetical protein
MSFGDLDLMFPIIPQSGQKCPSGVFPGFLVKLLAAFLQAEFKLGWGRRLHKLQLLDTVGTN